MIVRLQSFWVLSSFQLTLFFRNQDIISHLVKLLSAAVREIVGTDDENDHDGINMIDIAEGCTGALQNMAKDRESRELIRNMNIIPAVCDLMCIDHQAKVSQCLIQKRVTVLGVLDILLYFLLFLHTQTNELSSLYKKHQED